MAQSSPQNGHNDRHSSQNDNDGNDERSALLPSLLRGKVAHEGESGRHGFHPRHFLGVTYRSSNLVSQYVNILWPFVPLAIIFRYVFSDRPLLVFAFAYIGMIPSANLLGFAGQEFAKKLPKVAGTIIETTFGSIVEIILFVVLILKHRQPDEGQDDGNGDEGNLIPIIQAAILGSILTNLLLCLGLCFFVGGLRQTTQKFHAAISETGNGLLLVAAFGLLIPSAFYSALKGETTIEKDSLGFSILKEKFTPETLQRDILKISQVTSIVLIIAFVCYVWYNARSQHSIFDEVIQADEHRDMDREEDEARMRYTGTETAVALIISLIFATLLLIYLVEEIEAVVHSGVPDQFLGLILLPLVEKAAEHLTAIDEAYDGVINVALYHCLGPSIQTALFNGPLVVLVGWALGKPMDLNFEIFMIVLVVLGIIVVGNFLRDGESNWLEGALLVIVYVIIAIASWYYPNPDVATSNGLEGAGTAATTQNITIDSDVLKKLLLMANMPVEH
ncbi:vacuolar calcium ion transporter [Physcia stellaris]|nr:vacuolar calcium ion transporter [Physcia stellaris]